MGTVLILAISTVADVYKQIEAQFVAIWSMNMVLPTLFQAGL